MKKTNRELQHFIATEVRRLLDQVVQVRGSGYSCTGSLEREIQRDVPDL